MARNWLKKSLLTLSAITLLTVALPTTSWAVGYYNLPGSICQCFGYGNGAGHHACLMLGPIDCRGACATNEVRVECPPQPPTGAYGYYGPPAYENPAWSNPPAWSQPAPTPTPANSLPVPAAAQRRPVPRVW